MAALSYRGPGATLQMTKQHAQAYIKLKNIRGTNNRLLEPTTVNITAYVNDKKNDSELREGLLTAWNKGKGGRKRGSHFIKIPEDLQCTEVTLKPITSLEGYDSDDDKKMDMEEYVKPLPKKTLVRGDGTELEAPELDFRDAIRFGRQYVKRGRCKQSTPFVSQIGPDLIEFASPGTEDIYGTPLKRRKLNPEVEEYQRKGTSREFNFKNLVEHMTKRYDKVEDQRVAVRQVFDFVEGKQVTKFTSPQSELAGAIGCDGMKGVSGMLYYVNRARTKLDDKSFSLQNMFVGDLAWYRPATDSGRSRNTRRTAKIKQQWKENKKKTPETTTTTTAPGFVFDPNAQDVLSSLSNRNDVFVFGSNQNNL
jgi:hypothetical protein